MFRFFVDKREGDELLIEAKTLNHMKVARVLNEQFICVHEEQFYICKLNANNNATIIEKLEENHEFDGDVTIAISFIDPKRFEWLIQKASELGATKIIPMISDNVAKKLPHDFNKKLVRWNEIALNASEQSFRNKALKVEGLMKFKDVIKLEYKNKFIAHEKKDGKEEFSYPTNSIFLIGPEGGFSDSEVQQASQNGYDVITLGKRILRAETAPLKILSRIN